MNIILKNANFIDWQSLKLVRTSILISDDASQPLGFINNISQEHMNGAKIIDCKNLYVTKSFSCGHHHVYSALARGMGAPKKNPINFYEILQYVWWTLDKCLDKDMVRASALATAIQCAKNGVTFVIDHHASPNFIKGSLDVIAEAFEEVGVGHLLCYEITDRDGLDKAEEGLAETENYLKSHSGLVGLHASFTVGNDTLKKSVDLARKTNSGIHVHVAEDLYDQEHCIENYGCRVVERFHNYGVMDFSKTIFGHCLHLQQNERELINKSPIYVVQNIESNQNNNVGAFNGKDLGSKIMLGTDGMHSNMLRSAQTAYFAGIPNEQIGIFDAYKRLRMVNQYLSENKFNGNEANNLVIFDYDSPTIVNDDNILGHLFYGMETRHIQHVISNGKLIVENQKITTVNEDEVLEFSKEQGLRLWSEMKK